MLICIILLIIGLSLLVKGADFFVEGASAFARKFKIPQIIIGLTIVAMGTSAPEASISIVSALKGVEGVAIGNVLGSNIANIFLILGISSIIGALVIQKNTIKYEIPFVGFITVLTCALGYYFNYINRLSALILLLFFIIFLIYLYKISLNQNQEEEITNLSGFKTTIFILGGLIALVYGSNLTVESAVKIAHYLNISDRIIGLTIIAIGTSLPELVTCIIATLKKQTDLVIGNIIGSNIFNLLFVLGLASLIQPIKFDKIFVLDGSIAFLAAILLFIFTYKKKYLSRYNGVIFLILYSIYMGYLIIK